MKTCTKCGETKPLTEFHKSKITKDGHAYHCKSCVKKYQQETRKEIAERERRYREENKEAILERRRRYHQENREVIAERKRRYRQENKEAIKEYNRQYRRENKEVYNGWQRRHYYKNKEAILERHRQHYETRKAEQPGCVYQIVNSINGKVYVGETIKGELRWHEHRKDLRGNRHDSPHLQADFNEFGEDAFEWRIIQELPKDREVLRQEEKNTIQRLLAEGKELYNVQKTSEEE